MLPTANSHVSAAFESPLWGILPLVTGTWHEKNPTIYRYLCRGFQTLSPQNDELSLSFRSFGAKVNLEIAVEYTNI